jgi:hypothetical protein
MTQIELNKTYFREIENYSFGDLSIEALNEIFRDGRVASHLLEPQLVHWFPQLTHIKGCRDHDHTDGTGQKYDAKNFTKGGLKFKPSNMIGTGRTFNYQGMVDKAQHMIYIACDIIDFPQVRVIFKEGMDLVREYPDGEIKKSQREVLFS